MADETNDLERDAGCNPNMTGERSRQWDLAGHLG